MTDTATIRSTLGDIERGKRVRLQLEDGSELRGQLGDVNGEGKVILETDDAGAVDVAVEDIGRVLVEVRSRDPE